MRGGRFKVVNCRFFNNVCADVGPDVGGGAIRVFDQYEFRRDAVLRFIEERAVDLRRTLAVAGRGGLTKPIAGGVYRVSARMIRDLRSGRWGEHPSSLGAPLAAEIGRRAGAPAFIADPVVVDEFWPPARYAGHPAFERRSRFHALSQRAAARRAPRRRVPRKKRAGADARGGL